MFQVFVFYACMLALAALMAALVLAGLRQVGRLLLRTLKPVALAALLPLAALLTDFAGEKNTNMPMRVIRPVASQAFSSCGAITNAGWLAHGAYGDWFRIPATNWWARTADGWLDGVTVFAFCEFRPDIRTTNAFPRPFPQKLSLAPMANWHMLTNREALAASHESLFWHGVTGSNTLVMTWMNGLYERCATNLVSFQAELFNDGSVAYRYDGSPVATNDFVVPLELPFDRDGDGLENSVDPDPLVAGPDAHGTSAEWYNVVCSNVFTAVEGGGHGVPALPWREGVNSNAYYFVDVVSERGPSPICFTGDRTCRFGNPAIVALAGETNRVPLLIGINYAVTSDTPFTVSFPVDYPYVEVETNEPCVARIRWPLDFQFTESIGPSNRTYAVAVVPYDPGGEFSWGDGGGVPMRGGTPGGGCSCVSYDGHGVVFGCTEQCPCAGTCLAVGTYSLENASFPFAGGECRCGFDDPEGPEGPPAGEPSLEPSLSVSFSDNAVIFEDTYEDKPGVWMPKRSNRVRLTVSASGGSLGGVLTIDTANLGKLSPVACGPMLLPPSVELAPYDDYYVSFLCEGGEESDSAGDVSVSGTFVENGTGETISSSNSLSVVKVEIKPTVVAPANDSVNRHSFGVCEYVEHRQYPSAPAVVWNPVGGGSNVVHGIKDCYQCPLDGCDNPLRAEIGTVLYTPKIKVIEPQWVSSKTFGHQVFSNAVHKGEAGGIGMKLYLYVGPFDVSFCEISVEEVPSFTYEADGYFANPYYNGAFGHTGGLWGAGAGTWLTILREDNRMYGYDIAAFRDKIPWLTPEGTVTTNPACSWTDGEVYIDNPFGWNVTGTDGDTPPYKEFGNDIQDTIRLDAQGRVGVFKLDNWVERTTNDVVRLHGPLTKEEE